MAVPKNAGSLFYKTINKKLVENKFLINLQTKLFIMKKFVNLLVFIGISIIYIGCGASKKNAVPTKQLSAIAIGSANLAQIYNPVSTTIHPNIFIRKNNSQDIDLYVVINDNELLFSKANAQNQSMAKVRVFYKMIDSYENNTLIDSSLKVITIKKSSSSKTLAIKIKLKPIQEEKFVLQTTVTDLNRGKMNISFIDVDKNNSYCYDNFSKLKIDNSQPYTDNFIHIGDTVNINFYNTNYSKILKSYLPTSEYLPETPYFSYPAQEHKLQWGELSNFGVNDRFIAEKSGIYIFTADTSQNYGLTLPCFSGNHPYINEPHEMLKLVKYLTSNIEFDTIINNSNVKLSLDDFWYSCSHDLKNAKDLIKIYYSRAVYANIFFTDYRQGMFTDRGMVYIVLGAPKKLALRSDCEIWTYTDKKGYEIKFVFNKDFNSQFATPEYSLKRSTELKTLWDEAVKTWRSGKAASY